MALIDKASLLMVPSVYEDGTLYNVLPSGNKAPDETGNHNGYDQTRADFTFSRGSNLAATRVNASGLIEKGRENLILQSNNFGTTWSNSNTTESGGQSGYDGSNDAWLLTKSAANAYIYQNTALNGIQTFSVYAKSGTLSWMRFVVLGTGFASGYFNLTDGSLGSISNDSITSSSEDIGGGWYRFVLVLNASISQVRIYPAEGDNNASGTSGNIYIQDAQLEAGLVATDYIETTTTTAKAGVLENMPRIDYSSGAGALLLESQRTNLLPYSEYYDGWGIKSGVTATTNAITSPDGLQNASTIAATNAATNYIGEYYTFSASTKYTYSVFVKNNTSTKMRLQVYDSSQYATLDFDQTDSVLYSANLDSYDFVDYGNGWRRVIISFTTSSGAGSGYVQIYPDRNGNNHSMYVFGAQLEAASHVSSYIPTMGTAASRAADVCIDAGNSDVFNDSEGVLFVEMSALAQDSTNKVITISDGTTANRVQVYYNSSNNIVGAVAGQAAIAYSIDITQDAKIAFKYKANDFALWVNGTEVGTDTLGSAPSGLQEIDFHNGASGSNFYGNMKQLVYFNEALSDSELATLTTL